MSDQAPHEPNTARETTYLTANPPGSPAGSPTANAIAGGTILACVVLILVLSLRNTPGSPHGASLALIVGGGTLSAFATFYLTHRGRSTRARAMTTHSSHQRSFSEVTGHETDMGR